MSAVRTSPHADAYERAYASRASARRFNPRPTGVLRFAAWVALGAASGIAVVVALSGLVGYQSFTVLSGSMEPAISTGDVILVKRIAPTETRIGDVVTFRSPDEPTKIISHRVRSMGIADGVVRFMTRGDANTGSERWQVPANGQIGKVAVHVPKLGYVTNRVGSRFGKIAFLVLPALLLLALELKGFWRREKDGPDRKDEGNE